MKSKMTIPAKLTELFFFFSLPACMRAKTNACAVSRHHLQSQILHGGACYVGQDDAKGVRE